MAKYRKKPIVIEAVQFDPYQRPWPEGVKPWSEAGYQPRDGSWGYISTLAGNMHVQAGDWIIRGIKDELYSCKPDIFALTYELVRE